MKRNKTYQQGRIFRSEDLDYWRKMTKFAKFCELFSIT